MPIYEINKKELSKQDLENNSVAKLFYDNSSKESEVIVISTNLKQEAFADLLKMQVKELAEHPNLLYRPAKPSKGVKRK